MSERTVPRALCTIASANYLAHVRTLAASARAAHPDVPFFALLVDRVEGRFDPAAEPFEVLIAEELPNLPAVAPLFFKYDLLELNTAVKPFFLEHLFATRGIERLLFLDPDIWVLGPLDRVFERLDRANLLVTPHITEPIRDRARPSELDILRAGVFNLGFLGLRHGDVAAEFLRWWQERLYARCEMDPLRAVHVDQKWVDLAPSCFPGTEVLADRGLNVGYWNLLERGAAIGERGGRWFVGDEPLGFFHFSGFDPADPDAISRHQDRFRLSDFPALAPLASGYAAELRARGWERCRTWTYSYDRFDHGLRIPGAARRVYRELGNAALRFGDPFHGAGTQSFLAWLNEPAAAPALAASEGPDGSAGLSRLHLAVWESRPDLQRGFPRPWIEDRDAFVAWLATHATVECGLDESLLPSRAREGPGAAGLARRARQRLGRGVLRAAAPLEARALAMLGRRSPLIERARALKRRLLSEVAPQANAPAWASPAASRARPLGLLSFGVNVVGYARGEFGVGEMARASVRALEAVGIPRVLVEAKTHVHRHEDPSFPDTARHNPFGINLIHVNADQVDALRQQLGLGFFRSRRNVGVWFWETEPFPERCLPAFRPFDEIWVASRHVQDLLARVSPIPVVRMTFPLVPGGSPAELGRERFGLAAEDFVFLFHFDFLSELERKNPLAAVRAFRDAFPGEERVKLVLKSMNSSHAPDALARLGQAVAGDARIRLLDGHMDRAEVLALVRACDAYLSLHRAEGLGLGIAEAMAFGKPVIATGYSGNLDLMTPSNSFAVGYQLVELDRDHGPYPRGSTWAEPDVAHAARLMRAVVKDRASAAARGAEAARDLRARFSRERAGLAMRDRLRVLAPDLPTS